MKNSENLSVSTEVSTSMDTPQNVIAASLERNLQFPATLITNKYSKCKNFQVP